MESKVEELCSGQEQLTQNISGMTFNFYLFFKDIISFHYLKMLLLLNQQTTWYLIPILDDGICTLQKNLRFSMDNVSLLYKYRW